MTYLHKFKCMDCHLHFIVCSWGEKWPEGSRQGLSRLPPFCPECGANGHFIRWSEQTEREICEFVPGGAAIHGVGNPQDMPRPAKFEKGEPPDWPKKD